MDEARFQETPLARPMAERWWAHASRGALVVLFALAAFFWPGGVTFGAIAFLWAVYAFADGLLAAGIGALTAWWSMLVVGSLGVAAGVFTLFSPGLPDVVLVFLIAAWSALRGSFDIAEAVTLRREVHHQWLLVVSGIVSLVFAGLVMSLAREGAMAVVRTIGVYALLEAVLLVSLGLLIRNDGLVEAEV